MRELGLSCGVRESPSGSDAECWPVCRCSLEDEAVVADLRQLLLMPGDRVADCAALEMLCTARYRGFESRPVRKKNTSCINKKNLLFFFLCLSHCKNYGLNLVDCIIAFAPGGLETMIAMGTLVNADPSYVAIHHISRIFFLSFLVPFLIYKKPAT